MFIGSIRYNIDPLGEFKNDDTRIWSVLREVHLESHVKRLKDQLDTEVTGESSVFSVG